ncbi:MAG: alpha-1,2-fucosyltransferase [Lachnospiraceae bacterium]|nr:alpha-1,2-fucosyltransferase [Lachnospiraceae bacterium]
MGSEKKQRANVVRISDGLGNQLFQYAFGYSLYKRTGKELLIDPMYSGKLRHYQLDSFQIDFRQRFVGEKADYVLGLGARNAAPLRLKCREQKIRRGRYPVVKEPCPMRYDESVYQDDAAYYIGFWQSHQYFDAYYDDIKRQFQYKEPLSAQAMAYLEKIRTDANGASVSLHIRRTDYNRTQNNVCLGDVFYRQALERMQRETGSFALYIFTDDKYFVRESFAFHDFVLIEGVSDLEEFVLMQKCRNHIIANSTYSWWGAYLADNKGGVVCAPVSDIWTDEFYLPQWNKIDTQVGNAVWQEAQRG